MDVILQVEGQAASVRAAHAAAWQCFDGLLSELVSELAQLRQPVHPGVPVQSTALQGVTARRMYQACYPFCSEFITPMAAVAGAVAQELIARCQGPGISRAWANNGGDIALHLAPGYSVQVGVFADLARLHPGAPAQALQLDGRFVVRDDMPVRGIATSGWRGRSLSMGIADSVTVLAASAAQADAAATLIANAVNVAHPAIERRPASQCRDNSDLGERCVTVHVPVLPADVVADALAQGLARAQTLQQAGLIFAAALVCQGQMQQTPVPDHNPLPLRADTEAAAAPLPLVLA